jgi:hypothetical protein
MQKVTGSHAHFWRFITPGSRAPPVARGDGPCVAGVLPHGQIRIRPSLDSLGLECFEGIGEGVNPQ